MANITEALKTDLAHAGDFVPTPAGDLGTVSGLANLKQALYHRLVTKPGSLAHRPTYGVGVNLYQNAPNSITIQQELALKIKAQFMQDPRVADVTSVAFDSDDTSPQLTKLSVTVKPVGYSEQEMLFAPFGKGV